KPERQRKSAMNVSPNSRTWRILLRLATPYWRQCLIVILLALLGTTAELVEPLIYRTAINDVAGVFVQRAAERPQVESSVSTGAKHRAHTQTPVAVQVQHSTEPSHSKHPVETGKTHSHSSGNTKSSHHSTAERHHRGHVAPRTVNQMFSTLLWAVFFLFV